MRHTARPKPRLALLLFHHNMEVDICAFGMRHLHSAVKARGYEVDSLYVGFDPESRTGLDDFHHRVLPELTARVAGLAPDVVGLSVFSCYVPIIRKVIAELRRQAPDLLVVAGGPDPTLAPERLLSAVDYLFRGECEAALPLFLDRLAAGEPLESSPNVWCRRDGATHRNAMLPLEQELDRLALPDFEDDGHHHYLNSLHTQIHGSMEWYSLMASRGCPYSCEFCVNPVQRQVFQGLGKFLRRRSVASVIAELREVRRRSPGLRKIYFYDEVFTTDRAWVEEFAAAYRAEIGLPFFCQTDPRIHNRHVIPQLAGAGLCWLSMGIQGAPRVSREFYDRPYDPEDILSVAAMGREHGFKNIFDLIIDEPFSTDDDRMELLRLLLQIPRPFVLNTYSLLYFPGYLTTERALASGLIDARRVEGAEDERFDWNRFMKPDKDPRILFWECLLDLTANSDYSSGEILRIAEDPALRRDPLPFVEACVEARRRKRITYIPEAELRMVEDGNTGLQIAATAMSDALGGPGDG